MNINVGLDQWSTNFLKKNPDDSTSQAEPGIRETVSENKQMANKLHKTITR